MSSTCDVTTLFPSEFKQELPFDVFLAAVALNMADGISSTFAFDFNERGKSKSCKAASNSK